MFEAALRECYIDIIKSYPWVRVSESGHFFLGHGAELVKRNNGYGVASLSEQGSESKLDTESMALFFLS